MTLHRVQRYRGLLSAALLLVVAGSVLSAPWLVALAGVPVLFVAYGALGGVPNPSMSVERSIDPERAVPGEPVAVTLTLRNESDRPLADVRVVDGAPEDLTVVDGASRSAVAIPPDDEATITYEVIATRGEHEFADPRVRIRGTTGGSYRDRSPSVGGSDRLVGRVFVDEPPTRPETATLVGTTTTDRGESGVEFHTTREYRPGDPINRIDWRRKARSGELSTVNYRTQEGVAVTIVVDCRSGGERTATPGGPPSTDLCLYAADRALQAFLADTVSVGLAVLGPRTTPWVAPDSRDALARGRVALRTAATDEEWGGPMLGATPVSTDPERLAERLDARLPASGQVLYVTPLLDEFPVTVARQLRIRSHPVTVLSPDLGWPATVGGRLATVERRTLVDRTRALGVPVVDWSRRDPLPIAIEAAEVRGR